MVAFDYFDFDTFVFTKLNATEFLYRSLEGTVIGLEDHFFESATAISFAKIRNNRFIE